MRFDEPALRSGPGLRLFLFGPGKGESVAIRSETSGWIVIDSLQRYDGKEYVNPALRLVAVDGAPLACVILTHPHTDHADGLPGLVDRAIEQQATVSSVDRFARMSKGWDMDPVTGEDPGAPTTLGKVEAATAAIERSWREGRAKPWRVTAGESRTFGDVTLTALWPDDEAAAAWNGSRATANTVSTPHLLEWGSLRLLLGADLPSVQWEKVKAAGHGLPLHDHGGCKLPHHGSHGARHDAWAIGGAERCWALTGYGGGTKKLPDLSSGGGAEILLADVERLVVTALPFTATLPPGSWSLTPAAALAARDAGRPSAGWGVADAPPSSGPLDGWVRLHFQTDGSADVAFGDRAGALVRP